MEKITKIDTTTVGISTPQPDKVIQVPLKYLYKQRDTLQMRINSLNNQIAQAESLGVVKDVPVIAVEPVLGGNVDNLQPVI